MIVPGDGCSLGELSYAPPSHQLSKEMLRGLRLGGALYLATGACLYSYTVGGRPVLDCPTKEKSGGLCGDTGDITKFLASLVGRLIVGSLVASAAC